MAFMGVQLSQYTIALKQFDEYIASLSDNLSVPSVET